MKLKTLESTCQDEKFKAVKFHSTTLNRMHEYLCYLNGLRMWEFICRIFQFRARLGRFNLARCFLQYLQY